MLNTHKCMLVIVSYDCAVVLCYFRFLRGNCNVTRDRSYHIEKFIFIFISYSRATRDCCLSFHLLLLFLKTLFFRVGSAVLLLLSKFAKKPVIKCIFVVHTNFTTSLLKQTTFARRRCSVCFAFNTCAISTGVCQNLPLAILDFVNISCIIKTKQKIVMYET